MSAVAEIVTDAVAAGGLGGIALAPFGVTAAIIIVGPAVVLVDVSVR